MALQKLAAKQKKKYFLTIHLLEPRMRAVLLTLLRIPSHLRSRHFHHTQRKRGYCLGQELEKDKLRCRSFLLSLDRHSSIPMKRIHQVLRNLVTGHKKRRPQHEKKTTTPRWFFNLLRKNIMLRQKRLWNQKRLTSNA